MGRDYTKSKNYSDAVALEIDQEVRKIIDMCYKRAKDIIQKNKDLVNLLSDTLMNKETLTKEEIEEIVANYKKTKTSKKPKKSVSVKKTKKTEEK